MDFPLNVPVPISLIVRKNPNKSCYPKDDGIDTLTKIYYFTGKDVRWYRADGSYLYFRGSFAKKPKDSFTFHISADRDLRINRFDTLFDYPCKGDKILYYMDRTKYNSFFGRTNIGGQKYVCDTIHNFFFSYLKTGNGVYMKSYIKLGRDSVVFNGYQIK